MRFLWTVLCVGYALLGSAQVQFVDKDWQSILTQAQQEDKLIFLDAYTDWCEACKEMDRVVFTSVRLKNQMDKCCIPVKLNMEKGQGPALAFRYGVRIFPGLLVLSPTGTLITETNGYQNVDQMISLVKSAENPELQYRAMEARYDEGDRHPDFLYRFLDKSEKRRPAMLPQLLSEYFTASLDWTEPRTMDLIIHHVENSHDPKFRFILDNRQAYNNRFTEQFIDDLVDSHVNDALAADPPMSIEEIERLLHAAYPAQGADMADAFIMQRYVVEKNYDAFCDRAISYVNRKDMQNPDDLNDLAWQFYELTDKDPYLNTAISWAERAIKKQKSYYIYDTLASLYYKTGNKKKAKKNAKKAIKTAKKLDKKLPKTEELLAKIKKIKKR